MEFLFNYKGQHIASVLDEKLYSQQGVHIGRYLLSHGIYVDLDGKYLGQVPFARRLLHNDIYNFADIDFGSQEKLDNIDTIVDIGDGGAVDKVEGFSDIHKSRLK